ncbi:MAG TPA: PKD domain-containing protein, partial [Candidatus Deferrimicrobium sp.]|nr:PKD domain-containing protein [Candidatus Deferrimicrobium sp.]
PVADPGPSLYSGTQGQPITFSGIGSTSVCGFPTLRWDFSDGGVAWGALPQHTFQGSGLFSGLLTATDDTGLTNTKTFAIDVADAAPIANAGPATSAAWGRPVQFNGSATDGAADLATLSYSWSFGDGSAAASGASVVHSYAAPGVYTATLTVKDQHGMTGTDTRVVTVNERGVTSAFLGDDGIFDTAGTLRASFTDQFGNPVPGRTVQFTVDGGSVGSAQTNASGVATIAWTPAVDAGSHNVSAAFAGDNLYAASTANGSVTVDKKATSVSYTGALNGGPNKTVTLSAVLKDATGKALAGRTITFKLGTQTASAVTDATGVAKASLQLNQKNGSYSLTATFAPTGADGPHYTGNAAAATFNLKK